MFTIQERSRLRQTAEGKEMLLKLSAVLLVLGTQTNALLSI
jgi:hypothetical protein